MLDPDSSVEEAENIDLVSFDGSTKLKMVMLRKYYSVLDKKMKKFIEKSRKMYPQRLSYVCRFCGGIF